ncbi:MAG: hypothetical protein IE881_02955 [Epsilonproteobacteria bacterium]|nr:hypothetical protein [Campylobacterota bacterium]
MKLIFWRFFLLFFTFFSSLVYGAGETITLSGTLRDFYDWNLATNKSKNKNFQNSSFVHSHASVAVTGLVKDELDSERKPVLKSRGNEKKDDGSNSNFKAIHDTNSFNQWYRDVEGINQCLITSL